MCDRDRERLIELILKSEILCTTCGEYSNTYCSEAIADYLLANGVSVLPVPIGTTVFEIRARGERRYGHRKCDYAPTTTFALNTEIDNKAEFYVGEKAFTKTDKVRLNHTVFLTREEAEERLKKINEMSHIQK